MSQSGARQWRLDCTCHPEVAEQRHSQEWERMHSEVSLRNAGYFIEEDRVPDDVTEADLKAWKENYDSVVVCNPCGNIKGIDDGEVTLLRGVER